MNTSDKREPLYYIVGSVLIAFAIFLDVYFIKQAGSSHEDWLRHFFKGSFFDWLGLVCYNAGLVGLGLGMFGKWEILTTYGASLNRIWVIALAASIGLIAMG